MSAAVSTSRATSRTSRDKSKVAAQQTQTKTDGPPAKIQPTAEQLRIAQITSAQDDSDLASIHQLVEMTGKTQDAVAIALHDCGHDLERAALMLLEGEDEPGEWKEQGKKKKKPNASVPIPKSEPMMNNISDRTDNKRDHSRGDVDPSDRSEKHERSDHPPRRGRRNGGPPPRLARGRGRERNNFFGDRNENVENGGFRETEREEGGFGDQKWDTFRERENGFGSGFGRDRSGDRGRGRGRGKFGPRGRGRGSTGGPPSTGGGGGGFNRNPPKFDKGPQIDTWTNETAAIADKEPAGFGETWTGDENVVSEDWNDDSWQGELSDTKVFTASSMKQQEQDSIPSLAMNDTSDLLGQSNSLGQPPAIGQRLDIGTLLSKSTESTSTDSYIAQFNQQATESIKNTIGIGSAQRPNLGNLPNQTSANALNSFSPSLPQVSRMTSQSFSQGMSTQGMTSDGLSAHGLPLQSLSSHALPSQNMTSQGMTSQGMSSQNLPSPTMPSQGLSSQHLMSQGHLQQRPKSQRSKLPPPSKIPASAVEMPGHIMPQLDVQFGVDFGAESTSSFSFGSSDSIPQNNYSNSVPSSTPSSGINNHIGQQTQSKSPESMITSSMMSSPPGSKQQSLGLDQSSPRTVFQKTAYTTPPRNETESPLNQPNKMTQPDPIPFPPSQSDRKSSPLVVPQTGAALSQVSLSSTTSESPNLSSFGQSSGSYPSTAAAFAGHKASGLPVSQSYTHTTSAHSQQSSFQSQYQTSQNQYQSGQNQYQTGQSQFPSGSNQYQNYSPSGASFQSQSSYSSSQSNPNTLYQSSTPTSTYQSQTGSGSSFVRDSSSSQRPSSTGASASYSNQTSSSSFQNPTNPSFSSQANSSSYVHQSSGTPFTNQSTSAYTNQSAASYTNQSASASYPNETSGSFSNQSAGSYSNQPNSSSYQNSSSSLSTQSATQSQTGYNSQSFVSSGHQSALQTSPLTGSKLGDSLSKMTLKDSIPDSPTSQYDHSTSSSTSTSLTTTTATSSLSTGTTTVSSSVTSSLSSTSRTSLPSTTKAPPNLPPGVPLLGTHPYIVGQGSMPPFYLSNPSNLQQPLYNYEELLLQQQQRLQPLASSYYDMSAFPVPSTIAGRDQATLGSVPYSVGTTDSSKLNRVEAQSPNPTSQQQSTHSGQQPFINLHYGYYYPSMLPGTAAGYQYPQMFSMPPVTNAPPHAGTTATTQFQKTYASHGYNTTKGYDDLTQAPDFSKSPYGISGTQSKATAGTRTATAADLAGTYGKSHAQPFDKQAFHAGTPPPFNLPLASATQAGAMGAATYGAPFVPMMPHQTHAQMLHHPLQQDSTGASSRVSQQATSQAKVGSKQYSSYGWST